MKKIILAMMAFCSYAFSANANDMYAAYHQRAEQIYQKMTLDEKIGQLIMPSYMLLADAVSPNGSACQKAVETQNDIMHQCGLDQIAQYHLGAVLTGGGPYVNAPSLQNWAQLNQWADSQHKVGSPLDPILLTGNDTIHGNMHVQGAVIFPHNIGLGATHDPQLVQQIGQLVGQDSLISGFNWAYMPTIAVAQDLRWGRSYESFGQNPSYVKTMGAAYIQGFQNIQNNKITGTLATAKHFLGDGATQYGFDEGDDAYQGSQKDFWRENGQPYEGALDVNVGSIMVSYSAIDGDNTRMHFGGKWDIVNQFKNPGIIGTDGKNYRFGGFAVSDWNGPTRAAYFYEQATQQHLDLPSIMAKSINYGVDMIMLGQGDVSHPFDPNSQPNFTSVGEVFNAIKTAYLNKQITGERLEDAVTRILAVKLAMQPKSVTPQDYPNLQQQERQLALQAAQESLVLLKNEHTLPLNQKTIKNVVFVGNTNDLGLQNGGWTVNWQGQKGDQYFTGADKISSGASTLEESIKAALGSAVQYYHVNDQVNDLPSQLKAQDTVAIALVSEVPYAEFMGDIGNPNKADDWYNMGAANGYNLYLSLPQNQFLGLMFDNKAAAAIQAMRMQGIKVVTVVYSGRPLVLNDGGNAAPLNNSDAVIAAFLPGTLGGQALANSIFGQYHFGAHGESNTLSFPWPRNMDDIANHFQNGALYAAGFGLKD